MSFLRILRPLTRCRSFYTTKTPTQAASASSAAPTKGTKRSTSQTGSTTKPQSSCPADTILTGVNYLKGQAPVLALPDDQYPEWLWTILEPKIYQDDGPGGKAERVKRRQENRKRIKERNFMTTQ